MKTMENNTIDFEEQNGATERPKFLTVLCILTFVGSGLTIISSLMSLTVFTPAKLYATMEANAVKLKSTIPPFAEYVEWTNYSNIVSILCGVLGLVGGILMFKQLKSGFYLYALSWVAAIVMQVVAFEHVSDSFTRNLFPIIVALNILFMAAFVIMYGVNLKHMK